MLLKSKITEVPMYSGEHYFDGWLLQRLGKFTASKISCCMAVKGIGEGGLSYIRSKIGEDLTGISSEKELSTEEMQWGLKYERLALQRFGEFKGLDYLIVQKLVCDKDSKFGCTPDGIWVKSESQDNLSYEVSTVEVKCYPTYQNHIACALCENPEQIKIQDREAYYQTIMQMDEAGALIGYLAYFHPKFSKGGYRIIEFRKINLVPEFKLLNERKIEIMKIYEREKEILTSITN